MHFLLKQKQCRYFQNNKDEVVYTNIWIFLIHNGIVYDFEF